MSKRPPEVRAVLRRRSWSKSQALRRRSAVSENPEKKMQALRRETAAAKPEKRRLTSRHIQRLYDAHFPITVRGSSWLSFNVRRKSDDTHAKHSNPEFDRRSRDRCRSPCAGVFSAARCGGCLRGSCDRRWRCNGQEGRKDEGRGVLPEANPVWMVTRK